MSESDDRADPRQLRNGRGGWTARSIRPTCERDRPTAAATSAVAQTAGDASVSRARSADGAQVVERVGASIDRVVLG